MQDRKYQLEQVDKSCELVSTKRKVVVQLPTGGGKTVEFAMIVGRWVKAFLGQNNGSVLILVHREELMGQSARTIKEMLDIDPVLIVAGTKHFRIARVYIGMVDSLVSRLDCFANVGLVIIDEAHIASFNKVHNIFLEELIMGFTATPISSSKKDPMNKYYHGIVCGPQINQLIGWGYLAQNYTRCPQDIVDATKFTIDRMNDDYNVAQMSMEYRLPKHVTNVVVQYEKWCLDQKTIIFNVNIEHSREVAKCLKHCGYNVRHLASDNNHERAEIMKWFHDTEDAILCNVMMFTFGFDEPTIRKVILNFSTLSLPKFLRASGRGGRFIDLAWIEKNQHKYPYEIKEKTSFDIIDMGGNACKFGDWNADRNWERMFNNPQLPGDGLAPVKTCPQCDGLVHAAVRICPLMKEDGELCLYEFERKKLAEEKAQEMILVTKIDETINKNRNKYKYFTMFELAVPIVHNMRKTFGLNPEQKIIDNFFKAYFTLCILWHDKAFEKNEDVLDDISRSGFHIRMASNRFNELMAKEGIIGKHSRVYDWNDFEKTEEAMNKLWLSYNEQI